MRWWLTRPSRPMMWHIDKGWKIPANDAPPPLNIHAEWWLEPWKQFDQLLVVEGQKKSTVPLNTLESAVLVLADQAISCGFLVATLSGVCALEKIQETLASLEKRNLLLCHHSRVLTLIPFSRPVRTPKLCQWLESSLGVKPSSR